MSILLNKSLVSFFMLSLLVSGEVVFANSSVDDIPDITGGAVPIIQYSNHKALSGTNLTSVGKVEYRVKVKNQTGDPLVADSLILIVDGLKEISGKEIFDRVKIEGADGITAEGKPYFHIPSSDEELAPFHESEEVTIRISNPNLLRFFPPNIRVRGLRRSSGEAVKGLLESLVQKGLLAPEEAANALRSPSPPVSSDNP